MGVTVHQLILKQRSKNKITYAWGVGLVRETNENVKTSTIFTSKFSTIGRS